MDQNTELLALIGGVITVFGGVIVACLNGAVTRLNSKEQALDKKEENAVLSLQLQVTQALTRIGDLESTVRVLERELKESRSETAKLEKDLIIERASTERLTTENLALRAHVLELEGEHCKVKSLVDPEVLRTYERTNSPSIST